MDSIDLIPPISEKENISRQKNAWDEIVDINEVKALISSNHQEKTIIKKNIARAIIIIDIDGTIVDNFPRQQAIFSQILRKNFPQLNVNSLIESVSDGRQAYSILKLIHPYCQTEIEFNSIKRKFIEEFLSDRFLSLDKPFPGVNSFFKWMRSKDLTPIFLSGRPDHSMHSKTREVLLRHFPILAQMDFELILKQELISDFDFKKQYLGTIKIDKMRKVLGYIDNESEICSYVQRSYSGIHTFHFISTQSTEHEFSGYHMKSWLAD